MGWYLGNPKVKFWNLSSKWYFLTTLISDLYTPWLNVWGCIFKCFRLTSTLSSLMPWRTPAGCMGFYKHTVLYSKLMNILRNPNLNTSQSKVYKNLMLNWICWDFTWRKKFQINGKNFIDLWVPNQRWLKIECTLSCNWCFNIINWLQFHEKCVCVVFFWNQLPTMV